MTTVEPGTVAYLVNIYPAVSHSFIRREIQALERQGHRVLRFALRQADGALVDPEDLKERQLTRYVLGHGAMPLMAALFRQLLQHPQRWIAALRLAGAMSRNSDRPLHVHMVYLAEACVLKEWMGAAKARHLHAHFATNPAEVAMLAHALGGPGYSFTAHGSDLVDRPLQIGLNETVARARFVVAVCAYGRSQIMRWVAHAQWPKIAVVHCGLSASYGEPPAEVTLPVPRRIVCVGRLSREKGQLVLIDAARMLLEIGCDFELVLVGDGPMHATLREHVAAMGLSLKVHFTGSLSAQAVRDEITRSRALVVPSLSEGLPVVIMEAMALGRPVVAPYIAGIPELVRDGENGWMYPAGDASALANAMQRCLEAPTEVLSQFGAAARQAVSTDHDVDIQAARLWALIESADGGSDFTHPGPSQHGR